MAARGSEAGRSSGSTAVARTVKFSTGPSMVRPRWLIASTCAASASHSRTSCPSRIRWAPIVPPMAPAPMMVSRTSTPAPRCLEPTSPGDARQARGCRRPAGGHADRAAAAPPPSGGLRYDPDVGLRLVPVAEDPPGLVVRDRARDDHILALLPVDRGGDAVPG